MLEGQQGKVELILMKMALLSLKVLECQMTLKKIKSHGEMAGMQLNASSTVVNHKLLKSMIHN